MLYGMLLIDKITCTYVSHMNNVINKFLLTGDKFMPEIPEMICL